jgi:heterotetrameric sarcosine oxidase gamma subunit
VAERPVARSAIAPAPPVAVRSGWEVSARRARGPLRIADHSPLAKVVVRADPDGPFAAGIGVPTGTARRTPAGALAASARPGEWLLLGAPGTASALAAEAAAADGRELVTVVDLTHGRTLVRLTGARADAVLAKVCGIDFADRAMPDGSALGTGVARVATDIVRDDTAGVRSYLLHCERSSGQHLFDCLLDAGRQFGIEIDGYANP